MLIADVDGVAGRACFGFETRLACPFSLSAASASDSVMRTWLRFLGLLGKLLETPCFLATLVDEEP